MNEEDLKGQLEKYYKGDSTEDDEKALRSYFNDENIPEGYEAEKEIFGYYATAGEIPEPSPGFEARILADIDASERKSRSMKRNKILPYMSAAAGLLILAGSYFFFIHRPDTGDTFTDPELAYAESMRILLNVSTQLNHGAYALKPVSKISEMTDRSFKVINKSTLMVEKNLKNLGYLHNAIEIAIIPVNKKINE